MVFRGLPRACWVLFYGKRSFSVTTPCARPTRVNTERLAERETLLHRLGSKLNRTVFNSCGNPIIRSGLICEARFFCEQSHSHQKRSQKRKLSIFGNTKQVIQDYDTVFDNSIPFRKNDPLRIYECSVPGLPTRSSGNLKRCETASQSFRSFSRRITNPSLTHTQITSAESCVEIGRRLGCVDGWAAPGRRVLCPAAELRRAPALAVQCLYQAGRRGLEHGLQ
jgi:hypothetical protein